MTLSSRLAFSLESSFPLVPEQQEVRNRVQARIEDGTYPTETTTCPCGHSESKSIADRDAYGLGLPTVMCLGCGLLRSEPRLTPAAWEQFCIEDLPGLETDPGVSLQRLYDEQVTQGTLLVRELPDLLGQVNSVYEVGSGAGGRLAPFKDLGKTVVGCDMDPALVAIAQEKGLDLVRGGPTELLAHVGGPADMVLLSWVLDRMSDPINELRAAIELVKPGGMLLVLVPGVRQIDAQFRGNLLRYLRAGRLYHYTESTLRYVLGRVGLDVILCDESIIAIARRPQDWTPATLVESTPNADEPASLLSYLTSLEREHEKRHAPTRPAASPIAALEEGGLGSLPVPQIAIKETTSEAPWPLGTSASLRVLAWPDYSSVRDIETHLRIAEPMYGKPDACLCLRYDAGIDPPMSTVQNNLSQAFERLGRDISLNILIVDDAIPSHDSNRLGQAITAAILVDPSLAHPRAKFIKDLGCPLITGTTD